MGLPWLKKERNERGFTLIEVLVAMLIFAVAIVGLLRASSESVSNTARLTHKAHADIVADNVLIRARMKPPVIGKDSGKEQARGQDFEWELITTRTELEGFLRLDVKVLDGSGVDILMTRTAYLRQD